jgi:hypothetical protein
MIQKSLKLLSFSYFTLCNARQFYLPRESAATKGSFSLITKANSQACCENFHQYLKALTASLPVGFCDE